MIEAVTNWFNAVGDLLDAIKHNADKIAGGIVTIVVICERIARVIPTNWDNRFLDWTAKKLYILFAILGVKVPDIVKVDDGKIITTTQCVAQEEIARDREITNPEPKA